MAKAEILNHILVPNHEILSVKERKEILESFDIPKEKLPEITESDPVIKVIKAKKGDVLRITRESITAGESTYYRVVV